MPRRAATAVAVLATVAGLAACGGSKPGYGRATQVAFLGACNPNGEGGQRAAVCTCVYGELTKRYSYDEFKQIDAQLRADPKKVPDDVERIVADCGSRPSSTSSSSSSSS